MNKPLIDWNTILADEKRKLRELYKTKTDMEKKVLEDTFGYDNLNSDDDCDNVAFADALIAELKKEKKQSL